MMEVKDGRREGVVARSERSVSSTGLGIVNRYRPSGIGHLCIGERQCIVAARVEVGELIDTVE
jgi:hypothetical protein